jgi:hypothetical protein
MWACFERPSCVEIVRFVMDGGRSSQIVLRLYLFIRVFTNNGKQNRGGRWKQGELPAL